jgi:hypothetical protein
MQYLILIMEDSNTLFCCTEYSRERERISWKCIENLGTRPKKFSPALVFSFQVTHFSHLEVDYTALWS